MVRRSLMIERVLPDLVIFNGKVITVDSKFSITQAVAVKDGKIIAVGATDKIKTLIGKQTKTIDLKGKTMLPGINDTHCHISDWALSRPPLMLDIRFPSVKSIADIVKIVGERASQVKPGEWILGEGWDEGYLAECLADPDHKPSKKDLDIVAAYNPVALTEYSGHRVWANSQALKMAGINRDTPNPVGGEIKKDPTTGEPTGLLYEKASMMLRAVVPPWTTQQRKEALLGAMSELNSIGITSFTDASIDREKWAGYNDMLNEYFSEGKWTCRVNMMLMLASFGKSNLDGMKEALKYVGCRYNFGNEWLKVGGAKIVADGIPPLKTAWMWKPYLDGSYGGLVVDGNSVKEQEENLREMIRICHQNRLQVGIHSCGEKTIDVCTDQYMKCIEEDPWDARHYIIHSDFARPETIKNVGEFGRRSGYELAFNVQSPIKWTISDFMETVVGQQKSAYQWPLRTMIDNGVRVANSSDAPVIYPDWKQGIQGAVLRESKATGQVSGPEQRITLKEAIATYTINGAWLDHMEKIKGSIELGKLADFCVLDKDILSVDPHEIKDIRTLMTIIGGRVVYDTGII